ncbi:MAG: TIR domain-containing protein [Planctomycetes bacterium]|nr:TIR domain-containing protein [Planctomycetota bacterium]
MSNGEQAVARVAEILACSERYPWKTARYLSRKLAGEGLRISTGDLENALLAHTQASGRQVRYSFFPARKSLDLLWGHVDVVHEARHLPDAHLETEFGDFESCDVSEDRIWCFLSHSFHDLPQVKVIYDYLIDRKYGVWLAEAEVLTGMMIVKAVQEGLELCDRFVLYASRNSLGSRWVHKEGLQAIERWGMQVTVIVDGRDDEVRELFADWIEDRWDDLLEERVAKLVADVHPDPAATRLCDLLVAGLGGLPLDRRMVALFPFPEEITGTRFHTIDELFCDSKER